MKSIAGNEVEVTLKYGEIEKKFNVELNIYQEFDVDFYWRLFIKNLKKAEFENMEMFDYISEILKTKEELLKFAELGKTVVKEFQDLPLFEIVLRFYDVIEAINVFRLDLKKK